MDSRSWYGGKRPPHTFPPRSELVHRPTYSELPRPLYKSRDHDRTLHHTWVGLGWIKKFGPVAISGVLGAITSKIKHAIKHKTSPARLAQLLQSSLAFYFSLQPMTAYRPVLDGTTLGVCNLATPSYLRNR